MKYIKSSENIFILKDYLLCALFTINNLIIKYLYLLIIVIIN